MGILMDGNDWIGSASSYSRASTSHTVSFWARLDDNGGTRRPFGNTGAWEMRTGGTGSNVLISDLLQSGTLVEATLTVGTYHHIAVCPDVSNTDRFIYLDGVLVDSNTTASFAGTQNGTFYLGQGPGGTGQGWYGAIDDFRIYERILTQKEIETIYTCRGTDGIIANISHWWPLDDGVEGATVSSLTDIVGGLNLTSVTNTPVFNYDAGIRRRRYV